MRLVRLVLFTPGSALTILLLRHLVLVLRHVGHPLVLVKVLLLWGLLHPTVASPSCLPARLVLNILLRILIPPTLATEPSLPSKLLPLSASVIHVSSTARLVPSSVTLEALGLHRHLR